MLRSFWSLKTQEASMGIINSGKVLALPQLLHPQRPLWNASSAVAPSCDLPLNPVACPSQASEDTCYEYQPFFTSTAVPWLWFSRGELNWGVYRAEWRLLFFFFFGVCGFLFILQMLWPLHEPNLRWVHEGMLALSCCWLLSFFFFPLIWMFSSWPVHWPERGREDSCIPQGTRIFREAGTAFSFSQQVAPWFLQSTSWKPWNTVSFWTKCATSAPFLPESGLGGCNLETYTKRGALTWDPAQKYGMAQAGATFWGSLKGHLISGLKLPSSAPDSLQPGLLWGHPSLSSCGPGSTCQQPEGRVNRGLINPEIWNF